MPGVLLCCSVHQAHRGAPWLGSYSRSVCQSLKGTPWVGYCSAVQFVRHLMGQPLYFSAAHAGLWGERAYGDGPPAMCDSVVLPCFHGCLAFLHRHFALQSSPSHPLDPSLHSQQQPSLWDCATIPKLQLAATSPSRGPVSLSTVCMAVVRTV